MNNEEIIDKVAEFLDERGFRGTDGSPEISLGEYSFMYNPETGDYVYTYPGFVWDEMGEETKFSFGNISEEEIHELFEENKEDILPYIGMNEEEWYDLDIVFKLSDVMDNELDGIHGLTADDLIETFTK